MQVPLLITDFLERALRFYGQKEAVVEGEQRWTYAEFAGRCYQLGHALLELGVSPGDRVGIVSPNTHYFLEAFFGAASIGAVVVPLNYRLTADDFRYCLEHAGAEVVLADSELVGALDLIPGLRHKVVAPFGGAQAGPGWKDWEELLVGKPVSAPPAPEIDENDLVSINYTSGTTARPKGVMLTHRNFYTNAYHFIAHFNITHHDVELWTLPMFHCNGWGGVYAITAVGAKHVIIRTPEPEAVLQTVQDEGVTFACMAPVVLSRILDHPGRERFQIETRPRVACAGAAPAVAHVRRLEEEMGWEFLQLYGLTETSPILTVAELRPHLDLSERYRLKARAGHPALGVSLRVVGENGEDVVADDCQIGEVAARGNMVFKGYWNQPEETAKVIRDGYFYTGDMATVSADGSINIVDRAKDVIISGGENISSIEVEDVLYRHPAVLEVAVIGVPDERWGETPMALVVARPGLQPEVEELREFCRANMAHFKVPTRYQLVESLPRTATGKLQKFQLRAQYWADHQRKVSG